MSSLNDLVGKQIIEVSGEGQVSLRLEGGWTVTIESTIVFTPGEAAARELPGDELGTAEVLARNVTGHQVQAVSVDTTKGLVLTIEPDTRLAVPPDAEFEAWNVVGPQGQRIVSMPGGELATWGAAD